MKRSLIKLSGLALAAVVGSSAFAQVVKLDCNRPEINLAGEYRTGTDLNGEVHTVRVDQDRCLLTITETFRNYYPRTSETHVWKLDISGKTEFQIPESVVRRQGQKLGVPTMKGLRGTATLVANQDPNKPANRRILLKIKIPMPLKDGVLATAMVDASIYLGGQDASWLHFYTDKVRLSGIKSNYYFDQLYSAFLAGANYVLSYLDDVNVAWLIIPHLREFEKVK